MSVWHVLLLAFAALSLIEGVVIVGLLREVGGIYLQVGRPRPGQTPGQGPSIGDTVEREVLALSRPTILFFLGPGCSLCPPVAKAIPIAARSFRNLDFLPAVIGPASETKQQYATKIGLGARTDLDALYERWDVAGTPFAVGLSGDGTVQATGIVNSLPQIEALAESLADAALVRDADQGDPILPVLQEAP